MYSSKVLTDLDPMATRWTSKVCNMMAFGALLTGIGLLSYIYLLVPGRTFVRKVFWLHSLGLQAH